ncbi:hypothetical protein B0H12DRAFT_1113275 [Mycena haematopus]|nr:hypothetical protein B0H12DRAFT_1113275 [Mycena haematopus]
MAELPLELFKVIAKDVERDPSIFSLRLVSKTANAVVTPLAFRVVVVNDTLKSAKAVLFLQECDESITSLVNELAFRGDPEQDKEGEEAREALKTVFSRLSKFPKLHNLRFNFHDNFEEEVYEMFETPSRYLLLQQGIFRAMAANPLPPSLVSMTLNNLISIPDGIYLDADFHRILAQLHSLHISVLSNADDEGAYFQEPIVEFWDTSMSAIIRSATSLTTLTIQSDQPVGSCPALSFMDASLPQLASLTLHNFDLQDTGEDAVAFIIRHKATLSRLALRGCSIDGGEDGTFTRPWHAVLELFEKELDHLREFVFRSGDAWEGDHEFERDSRFRYTRLDPGWGYLPWSEELETEGLDLPALESLLAVVEGRRGP